VARASRDLAGSLVAQPNAFADLSFALCGRERLPRSRARAARSPCLLG
jgi:hypothetical protein